MGIPVAVQLYTVREETNKDFIGTLEKVANIGYKGVEFAGYGDIPASTMADTLKRLGLKAAGSHVGLDLLKDHLDEVIAYNLEIGNQYILCPWAQFETKNDYVKMAKFLNETGRKCKEAGVTLGYHNHDFEFTTFDGEHGLDILYKETEPSYVVAEIDTYWVQRAGVDPIAYVKKYAGRCPLIHLKDMEAGEVKDYAEVGNGIMDIAGIVAVAEQSGVKWLIVEQDKCKKPPLESIAISMENLKKMGIVK